jgi:hypothetical protein
MPSSDATSAQFAASPLAAPPDAQAEPLAPTGRFATPWVRGVVSLALAYHFIAVLVEPLAIPPRFASTEPTRLPEAVRPAFQPYMTALNLNQGYKFFAPDPGDSHLVRYDLYFADGKQLVNAPDNIFPDRRRDWPRLIYHRYFMLAEHLPTFYDFGNWDVPDPTFAPPAGAVVAGVGEFVPPVADDAPRATAQSIPAQPADPRPPRMILRDEMARGFAAYLAKKHGAVRVDLFHRVHRLSRDTEILDGRTIDQADTYRERLLISYKVPDGKTVPAAKLQPPQAAATKTSKRSESETRR